MPHVFVSYKREDRSFVDELERRILGANLTVWTDRHIQAGDNWEESIDSAIKNAFVVVLVMTPAARASEYVTYEWSFAMGMGIPIIPIMLIQTDVHPKLNRIQNLNFTNRYGEPWDALLTRLDKLKTGYKEPSVKALPLDTSIAGFVEDLKSPDAGTVIGAAETLAMMNHADAVPYLINALNKPVGEWADRIEDVQDAILTALGDIGDTIALSHIIRFATQGRLSAIQALAEFPKADSASKTLVRLYEKSKDNEPVLLAMAKSFIKEPSREFYQIFMEILSPPQWLNQEVREIRGELREIFEAENPKPLIEEFIQKKGLEDSSDYTFSLTKAYRIFDYNLSENDSWLTIVSQSGAFREELQYIKRDFKQWYNLAELIDKEIQRQQDAAK